MQGQPRTRPHVGRSHSGCLQVGVDPCVSFRCYMLIIASAMRPQVSARGLFSMHWPSRWYKARSAWVPFFAIGVDALICMMRARSDPMVAVYARGSHQSHWELLDVTEWQRCVCACVRGYFICVREGAPGKC